MTVARARRIGILGGTFDPVHNGHLKLLKAAKRALKLDLVYVVPTRITPLKGRARATPAQRLAMLRLALRPLRWAKASRVETARRGVSYTVDTLTYFRRRHPRSELFFIAGSDAVRRFREWKDAPRILLLCRVAVASRRGGAGRLPSGFTRVPLNAPESSTRARRAAASEGRLEGLLPPAVARYVVSRGLYGARRRRRT